MFDIGFPELLIVSVVALLVIGPEKLPETVRSVAIWISRIRRSLASFKTELENEIGADEIRRELHNDAIMRELNEAKQNLDNIVNDTNATITEIKDSAKIDTSAIMKPIGDQTADSGAKADGTTNQDTDQNDRPKSESG